MPYVSSHHPLCSICRARLFHAHPLSPKVKAGHCGHMYCAPCIAQHMMHHKDQGCPRCGRAFPSTSEGSPPEDALQDIYANTKNDKTDEWIRRASRECSDTVASKQHLQQQRTLLAAAERDSVLLTQKFSENASNIDSLVDCLSAAKDDKARAMANVEELERELALLKG